MKNKILVFLTWFATSITLATVNADLSLEDGFHVTGTLQEINTERNSLRILPQGASTTPWDLKLDMTRSIYMEQIQRQTETSLYQDWLVLNGGWREVIPVSIQSIGPQHAIFSCPFFDKPVTLPRRFIKAVKLHEPVLRPLLPDLPYLDASWILPFSRDTQQSILQRLNTLNPDQRPGRKLLLPSQSEWGKDMGLTPSSFELRLEVCIPLTPPPTSPQERMILFFGGDGSRSPLSNPPGLYLKSDGYMWRLSWRATPLTTHEILRLPIPEPGQRHHLFLSVTHVNNSISFSLATNANPPLRHILTSWRVPRHSWFICSIPHDQVELYGMRLFNKWDLSAKVPYDTPIANDRIHTKDEKTISGSIISCNNKTGIITIKTSQGAMEIPVEYAELMLFSPPAPATIPNTTRNASVVLRNGSRLYGPLQAFKQRQLTIQHPALGLLTIPQEEVIRIDFFAQAPPTRSTP